MTETIVHQNPWFKIKKQVFSHSQKNYFYLAKQPTVFIIPETKDNELILIKEYRYPVKKIILQLPAGIIEQNESALKAAKRELWEETGCVTKHWKRLGWFYVAVGHENTKIVVYYAQECKQQKKIPIYKHKTTTLRKLICLGKIRCGITLAVLNLYYSGNKKLENS